MNDITKPASVAQLIRYGLFAVTIAFGGLPIYIYLPKLYADEYHINLTTLGLILMVLRVVDALTDPIIGTLSDKLQRYRRQILCFGSLLLVVAFNALFYLPQSFIKPITWFTIVTSMVYLGYGIIVINYYATGLLLADNYQQRTRVAAFRETLSLLGIIVASILPEMLMSHHSALVAFRYYALIFIFISFITCLGLPIPSAPLTSPQESDSLSLNVRGVLRVILSNNSLQWILGIVFLNNLPTAFSSNLLLFYISDVLKKPHQAGYYLITYFFIAACSSIMWVNVAKKFGKRRALMTGIILAIIANLLAYCLSAQTSNWFYATCVISGLALGSDVIILPSLFADIIDDHKTMGGSFFSIWQALIKLTLAIGAGIALPLLSFIGYEPGLSSSEATIGNISIVYALLPCMIKGLVLIAVFLSPIDTKRLPIQT